MAEIDPRTLSDKQLFELYHELSGGKQGELSFEDHHARELALDSPHYFATEVVDSFYKRMFDTIHPRLLDEVMGPWIIGETVTLEGVQYDPRDWVGLLIVFPRGTFKSSCCRLVVLWAYLYYKLRLGEDLTVGYVHKVLQKAKGHGEGIRTTARRNPRFMATFPEFHVPETIKEWDSKDAWCWPNISWETKQADEKSFVAYGETSSKTGGHYKLRMVDDWEAEDSVTTDDMMLQSEESFRQMDNLKVLGRSFNPWMAVGTYYHYDGTYKRLERGSGWLSWTVPACEGSTKEIIDLVGLSPAVKSEKKKIDDTLEELERTRQNDLNFPKLYKWRDLYLAAIGQKSDSEGEMKGGVHQFNCQILCNPTPAGQERFDLEALNSSWVDEIPGPEEMWIYIRIDPALSQKKSASDCAIITGGVKWNGHRYFLNTWIGRDKRPTSIMRRAFTAAKAWIELGYKVKNIGVEAVQLQESFAQIGRDGIPERQPQYDGESVPMMMSPCPIVSIHRSPDARKVERIVSMTGPVERRECHFWVKDPGGRKLFRQYERFPHDKMDGLDGAHDLWVLTSTPPKPIVEQKSKPYPDELAHLFEDPDRDELAPQFATIPCSLSSW